MIELVFVATTDEAFGYISDCIQAVEKYIGSRYVKERTSWSLLVDTNLPASDRGAIYEICKKGKIEIMFISLPVNFNGNIRDLHPDTEAESREDLATE